MFRPLNPALSHMIGYIETRFKALCDTVLGSSTACPLKLYLILSVSAIKKRVYFVSWSTGSNADLPLKYEENRHSKIK